MDEIHAWRNPPDSWYQRVKTQANAKWDDVTELVRKIPGVDWTIENVVSGVIDLTNEMTQDSVWIDAILKDYQKAGHSVDTVSDVMDLDLEHIDTAVSGLKAKYKSLATAEGAATGFAGAAGIIPDLVALVALNLRAAGEYATYCGFDIKDAEERIYAMTLLDDVAEPSTKAKDMTFAPAVRTVSGVARRQSTQALEQIGLSSALESIARRLGIKLTEKKLAQVIPVTGALIGGGFNYAYTNKVCKTAYFRYRERFLEQKYGSDFVLRG